MDFEKIAVDFEKRFLRSCEKILFCGMPLTVMKSDALCLSAALSVGVCGALARREDGRFTAGFYDSQRYISENVIEAELHKSEPMIEFLTRLKAEGVSLGGAEILFECNTGIYNEFEPLLLSLMYFFCRDMPKPEQAENCLSDSIRDFAAFFGRKDALLLNGDKNVYIKFSDSAVKIVLCHIDERNELPVFSDKTVINAAKILLSGDYRRFGRLITEEYGESGMKNKTRNLFETARGQRDAIGLGTVEGGGIFAVVENKKVNAFIQNLKREYEAYFGSAPDFYITRTENSGIYGTKGAV